MVCISKMSAWGSTAVKRVLRSAIGVCLLLYLVGSTGRWTHAQDNGPISVGANVQVSTDDSQTPHWEVLACVDPQDSRRMVLGSMAFSPGSVFRDDLELRVPTTRIYTSTDAGRSWKLTLRTNDARSLGDQKGDPSCVFDSDGSVYYAQMGRTLDGSLIELFRSQDGGSTWNLLPTRLGPAVDRPYLIIDDNHGILYSVDQTYVRSVTAAAGPAKSSEALQVDGLMRGFRVSASTDHGDHFVSQTRFAFGSAYLSNVSRPVLLADGSLVSTFIVRRERGVQQTTGGPPVGWLQAVRVSPGGSTIQPAVTIADWYLASEDGSNIAVLAVDRGSTAFKGRLYVAWIDIRSQRARVWLSYSTDDGRSWARPRVVDDLPERADPQQAPNATHPSIAVNREGVVAVAWADRRGHSDNLGWNYRMTASFDGGDTFVTSIKVSSGAQRFKTWPLFVVPQNGIREIRSDRVSQEVIRDSAHLSAGHTVDMVVDNQGVFHPIWLDNRTGVMQVWTAPVTVTGRASRPDVTSLKGFQSVGVALRLASQDVSYDPSTQIAVFNTRVVNTSNAPVLLPVKLHITDLFSDVGSVRILNSDNGAPGVDAIWTFTGAQASAKELAPNSSTASRELRFRVTLNDPLTDLLDPRWRLFRYEADLLTPRPVR